MAKKKLSAAQKAALEKSHSPEARAKATATRKRNLALKNVTRFSATNKEAQSISLDNIPERKKYTKRITGGVGTEVTFLFGKIQITVRVV